MVFLDEVDKFFATKNLYEAIGASKDATSQQIKKAYHKTSLKCHPDRVADDEKGEATKKFQVLAKIHFILCDDGKRKMYDEHGLIDDDENLNNEADWAEYWRLLFPRVTAKDINNFMDSYIGSEDELKDLIQIYERCKGDMDKICQIHMSYDEDRTTQQIQKLIDDEKIKSYSKFTNEPQAKKDKRRRAALKEAAQAKKMKEKMEESKDDVNGDLVALIQQRRQGNFDSMISRLEQKYAKPETSAKKGTKRKRSNR